MFWQCGVLVLVLGINDGSAQLKSDEDVCQLPEGGVGTCIVIHKCKPVVDFLEKAMQPLSPLVIQQLKSYQCGFEGRNPKVCCLPNTTTPKQEDSNVVVDTPPDVSNHRNLHLLPKSCGYLDTDDPAIIGRITRLFEFPWMALLSYNKTSEREFQCGGTIINDRYILTAAHCIKVFNRENTLAGVRIGEHDINKAQDCEEQAGEQVCAPPVQDLRIQEIIPHPGYNYPALINDIGLLRVDRMNLTLENARPVCLPLGSARNYNFTNQKVILAGFGITETGSASPVLLTAELPVVNNEECQQAYNQTNTTRTINIIKQQLCAGGRDGKDSCAGDSGGPLHVVDLVNDEMRYIQQAIVSFGPRLCGLNGFPSVNTRVAYYMDWILDTIRP